MALEWESLSTAGARVTWHSATGRWRSYSIRREDRIWAAIDFVDHAGYW